MFTDISINELFKGRSPISLKTIVSRTKLTRKQARYFVKSKLRSGELRRVAPFEVGSGKFNGNLKNTNLSKDDKKKLRKNRAASFNRSWKTGKNNVFALV